MQRFSRSASTSTVVGGSTFRKFEVEIASVSVFTPGPQFCAISMQHERDRQHEERYAAQHATRGPNAEVVEERWHEVNNEQCLELV